MRGVYIDDGRRGLFDQRREGELHFLPAERHAAVRTSGMREVGQRAFRPLPGVATGFSRRSKEERSRCHPAAKQKKLQKSLTHCNSSVLRHAAILTTNVQNERRCSWCSSGKAGGTVPLSV